MPDNIGYTPGAGASVAADDIGGVLYQRIKPTFGEDGAAVDVSAQNPLPIDGSYGELMEAVNALRMAVMSLAKSIGYALPNASGQPIMEARQATAANLQVTATISGTPTVNVTTLANQQQIGAYSTNDYMLCLYHQTNDILRNNILTT
jgi:hypothetical protein